MKNWFQPTANSPALEWLGLLLFLLLVAICIGGFIVWLKLGNRHTKKKRKHKHRRPLNPTLSQTGGLPPRRDPNVPPPGP